jgi:hypothetical protein
MQQCQERISFAMYKPGIRFARNKQGLQELIAEMSIARITTILQFRTNTRLAIVFKHQR